MSQFVLRMEISITPDVFLHRVNLINWVNLIKWVNLVNLPNQHPLDETHLAAVRWLTHQEFQSKCVNNESSSERRCFVR